MGKINFKQSEGVRWSERVNSFTTAQEDFLHSGSTTFTLTAFFVLLRGWDPII